MPRETKLDMPREVPPLAEVRRITQKKRDAWWTVMFVDPVATPLVRRVAMHTRITPNQLTWAAFVVGMGSAGCFAQGDYRWLLFGAVLYHVSFVFDCMDGKLARLTGTGSVFGAWLDFVFDRVRVLVCAVALMGGQYARTGNTAYLWLAFAVASLDALRYIDSLEIFKIRHTMRKEIKARVRAARKRENAVELAFMEDLLRENPEADIEQDALLAGGGPAPCSPVGGVSPVIAADAAGPGGPGATGGPGRPGAGQSTAGQPVDDQPALAGAVAAIGDEPTGGPEGVADPESGSLTTALAPRPAVVDLHQEFRRRFPWYLRVRSLLLRHRIRAHLISGIEFQMGVFIVGPLVDRVLGATVVSGALLLVFELAIIYKLLLSTRDFTRTLSSFEAVS